MKKMNAKIIVCMAALSSVLVFTTCKSTGGSSTSSEPSFREPKMGVRSIELSKVSFTGVELLCKLSVENPNSFGIAFPEIPWEFFIGKDQFAEGVYKSNTVVKARSTYLASIPIKVDYNELFKTSVQYVGKKKADYTVLFRPKMTIPDHGSRNWKFEREGDFPILEVPAINFKNIALKEKSLTKLDFQLDIEIENSNNLDLVLDNLSYIFLVNNSRWSSGNVKNKPRLTAGGKAVIPISFSLNSLNVVLEITQIIARSSDISYAFSGDVTYDVNLTGEKDLGNSVNFNGVTRIRN